MRLIPFTLLVLMGIASQLFGEEPKDTKQPKTITNSIGMEFVLCPRGTFMMGSPSDEAGRSDDEQQHEVTLSSDFYLGVCEVTQGEWKSVMETEPWGKKPQREEVSDYPATYVLHDDAVSFCRKLSEKDGREYRLPTEAEWEYACRAGTTTAYSFGDNKDALAKYAWFNDNTRLLEERFPHQVGAKLPNPWGLYDMHGNVSEFCQDWYGDYPSAAVTNPLGPPQAEGSRSVRRGGGWNDYASLCRSAYRHWSSPDYRYSDLGFRVALIPSVKRPEAKESK
ncbi:MAG: formylglycine-generating enzyme family protein [Planctomycetota bacterium]|nr:formylglycine-generating enzyme family protein [Planctomycetota bacterium]